MGKPEEAATAARFMSHKMRLASHAYADVDESDLVASLRDGVRLAYFLESVGAPVSAFEHLNDHSDILRQQLENLSLCLKVAKSSCNARLSPEIPLRAP